MPVALMDQLPASDALAFRDAVVAREPSRLAELAGWLLATEGPIDELDASVESLVVLWPWFLGFVEAGCPGVPAGTVGQLWVDDGVTPRPARAGRTYAAEAIGHYLMLVARRLDPSAHWAAQTWKPVNDIHYQQTGILLRTKAFVIPDVFVNAAVRSALDMPPGRRTRHEPEGLRDLFLLWANAPAAASHRSRRLVARRCCRARSRSRNRSRSGGGRCPRRPQPLLRSRRFRRLGPRP
jgi:hypothetical protein